MSTAPARHPWDALRLGERLAVWHPIILLALLAALTAWLNHAVESGAARRAAVERHGPDITVENFSALTTGPGGEPRYRLEARKLLHYEDDDSTHLAEPRFTGQEPGRAPLRVSAARGLVSSDGEHVYFMDGVKVVRAPHAGRGAVTLTTSWLHLMPDQELARTDRAVSVTDGRSSLSAVGLELNAATRELKLLSDVRARYAPPRK